MSETHFPVVHISLDALAVFTSAAIEVYPQESICKFYGTRTPLTLRLTFPYQYATRTKNSVSYCLKGKNRVDSFLTTLATYDLLGDGHSHPSTSLEPFEKDQSKHDELTLRINNYLHYPYVSLVCALKRVRRTPFEGLNSEGERLVMNNGNFLSCISAYVVDKHRGNMTLASLQLYQPETARHSRSQRDLTINRRLRAAKK